MSDFRWIALALTVTAGCQVYDRVPWRRGWGWLTAKALALRSWVFRDDDSDAAYSPCVIDADDIEWVGFDNSASAPDEWAGARTLADAPKPRRRPSRASAAKARKAKQ